MSCPWSKLSLGRLVYERAVYGESCPWVGDFPLGKLFMGRDVHGRAVHGVSYPCGKMSWGELPLFHGASSHGVSCYAVSCREIMYIFFYFWATCAPPPPSSGARGLCIKLSSEFSLLNNKNESRQSSDYNLWCSCDVVVHYVYCSNTIVIDIVSNPCPT